MKQKMTEKEMLQRTKNFALRVIKLVNALPNNPAGRTIGRQLVRSGTSVAANYRAACRGRSKAEFIAKLGIEEEADESTLWLELLVEGGLMKANVLSDLIQEARELTAIMSASKITARKRK
jgi:four helix bundle protein